MATCNCCGREASFVEHDEEHALCSPYIKTTFHFCDRCHSDLFGHAIRATKNWAIKMYEKDLESCFQNEGRRKLTVRTLWKKSRKVLWRCRKCEKITTEEISNNIKIMLEREGIKSSSEVRDKIIEMLYP